MKLEEMFAAVSRKSTLSAERFLTFYNETVEDLIAQYGEKYVCPSSNETGTERAITVYDEPLALKDYDKAIINNILWLDRSETAYKELSMQQREYAYNTVWRQANKRKRVHIRTWM